MQPDVRSIAEARERLRGLVIETPLVAWGPGVWLKCENAQVTGSFKLRGALNKVLSLSEAERRRGVLAASAGNHGQGVAFAARLMGAQATIVVPDDAVRRKVEAIRRLGADVIEVPGGYGAAESHARELSDRRGAVWISPYNDERVIAGQGTIGLEIREQLPGTAGRTVEVLVPVSGGGLVSGIGLALEGRQGYRVVGVQPESAPYMRAAFRGEDPAAVVELPTIADALSGPYEVGSITEHLVRRVVADMWLVSEAEILEACRSAWVEHGLPMEPSSAVALAAAARPAARNIERLVVVSGGNVDPKWLEGLARREVAQ
ncbi:MAG TPA: threonine/serine dehydratase [Anaerolineales bacterium]|nr:threonine/serine dehydratase [Anaerolineales bacterium]